MSHRSNNRRPARLHRGWPCLLLVLACAGGLPKDVTRTITNDEREIHELGARVEELTALAEARELYMTPCAATSEGCELARRICEIAARHPERADMQSHCAIARDDCTRMDDLCMQRR